MLTPQSFMDSIRYDEIRLGPQKCPAVQGGHLPFGLPDFRPVYRVRGNPQALPWQVTRFELHSDRSMSSWLNLLMIGAFAGCIVLNLLGVVVTRNLVAVRSALLLLPFVGLGLYSSVLELIHLYNPESRGSVTLEADRLICDNGFGRRSKEILYEQIFDVDWDRKDKRVGVKYYPLDRVNNLNTSRTSSFFLPRADDESLQDELLKRAFGPPTALRARAYQVFAWVRGIVFVYGILALYIFLIRIVVP